MRPILSVLLGLSGLWAQQYAFVPHTEPGAPADVVSIAEDAAGALWLGSAAGLFRFDGTRFDKYELPGGPVAVYWIAASPDGSVWAASKTGFFRWWRGRLQRVTQQGGHNVAAWRDRVAFVENDAKNPGAAIGALWLGQQQGDSWNWRRIAGVPLNRYVTFDLQGNLLFPCQADLCEVAAGHLDDAQLQPSRSPIAGVSAGWDTAVRDRHGCIWLRNSGATAYRCPGEAAYQTLPLTMADVQILSTIFLDRDDQIWLVNERGPVTFGRPGQWTVARRENDAPRTLMTAAQTRDGTIWLGGASGLWHWAHPGKLEYWGERQGLSAPYSVLARSRQEVYATGSGLFRLTADRARWEPLGDRPGFRYATHALGLPNGNLMVTLWRHGLAEIDRSGRTLRELPPAKVFSAMRVTAQDDGYWVNGAGVYRVTPAGNRFDLKLASIPPPYANGLDMASDAAGRLWLCTGAGLFRQEEGRDQWTRWATANGLIEDGCRSMAVSPDGKHVWYGYNQADAFTQLDFAGGPQPQVHHYRRAKGFGGAFFLDFDRRGWLWRGYDFLYVSSGQPREPDDWVRLTRNDGFLLEGSNQQGFGQDPDGSLWLSADDNLYHFTPPADLFTRRETPTVFVSSAGARDRFEANEPVEVRFGSLQFYFRNRLRFRYRLDANAPWQTTRDTSVVLNGLASGRHRFELSARLAPGGDWTAPVAWEFTVAAPAWRQPATWAGSAGLALVGGWFAWQARRRARYSRQKQAFVEAMRDERSTGDPDVDRLLRLARDGAAFPDPAPRPQTPAGGAGPLVGERFEVVEAVAQGGFATVYRASDRLTQAPAAVKVFHVNQDERAWMLRRFAQEIDALSRIDHPNVVRLLTAGETPSGEPYLAMEFVEGITLRERLRQGPMPVDQVAAAARELGEALATIHAQGVIHRDLKPENLMVLTGGRLKVIDFSIAIARDPRSTVHALSRAAGSLLYMAPEQVFGYSSPGTDIYSFALVVFEMLTARSAGELGLGAASGALGQEVETALREARPELGPAVVLRQALALDVQSRPRDAADFGRRLSDWLKVEAKPERG